MKIFAYKDQKTVIQIETRDYIKENPQDLYWFRGLEEWLPGDKIEDAITEREALLAKMAAEKQTLEPTKEISQKK